MTREEAKEFIAQSVKSDVDMAKVADALKALEQEPTTKNNLGVDEVTALAEWIEKLTKASEDAYNKGYADGMKAQEPKTGEWIEHFDESGKWYECDQCHTDWGGAVNYCPNCGAKMESEVDNGNDRMS